MSRKRMTEAERVLRQAHVLGHISKRELVRQVGADRAEELQLLERLPRVRRSRATLDPLGPPDTRPAVGAGAFPCDYCGRPERVLQCGGVCGDCAAEIADMRADREFWTA